MAEKLKSVGELKDEIHALERQLRVLKEELMVVECRTIEVGGCRIKHMPKRHLGYKTDPAHWALQIRVKTLNHKGFTTIFSSLERQEVVDAAGFLATTMIELQSMAATQATN